MERCADILLVKFQEIYSTRFQGYPFRSCDQWEPLSAERTTEEALAYGSWLAVPLRNPQSLASCSIQGLFCGEMPHYTPSVIRRRLLRHGRCCSIFSGQQTPCALKAYQSAWFADPSLAHDAFCVSCDFVALWLLDIGIWERRFWYKILTLKGTMNAWN